MIAAHLFRKILQGQQYAPSWTDGALVPAVPKLKGTPSIVDEYCDVAVSIAVGKVYANVITSCIAKMHGLNIIHIKPWDILV